MPTLGLIGTYFFGNVVGFNPFSSATDKEIAKFTMAVIFVATGLLPVAFVFLLKLLGFISSIQIPNREERIIPFFLTAALYYAAIYLLSNYWQLPLNPVIYQFMIGATLATIIGMVITSKWKISVHMIGIGGVVGIFTVISKIQERTLLTEVVILLILSGLIGFSRIELKAHNYSQVFAGFILGFTCVVMPLFLH